MVAFIITVVICFLFMLAGFPLVLDFFSGWLPGPLLDAVASLSFLTHFAAISKGVLDWRDVLYFLLVIGGLAAGHDHRAGPEEGGLG